MIPTRAGAFLAALVLSGCASKGTAVVLSEAVQVNDVDGGYAQGEPAIAVDGSGGVAVAWIDWTPRPGPGGIGGGASAVRPAVRVARSTDGGATFSASVPALDPDPEHPLGQADPTLARDERGRLHLAWIACRLDPGAPDGRACDLFARSSDDFGATWSPPSAIVSAEPVRCDRPWLARADSGLFLSWSEVDADGRSRWVTARREEDGRFERRASIDGRASIHPLRPGRQGLEALLLDRAESTPGRVTVEHRRASGDGRTFAALDRIAFPRAAALLDYSLAVLAVADDEAAWRAVPVLDADGRRTDYRLERRARGAAPFRSVGPLRNANGSRSGMAALEPVGGDRFLAAWLEEGPDRSAEVGSSGHRWRAWTRVLGPGRAIGRAVQVSTQSFRFAEASLTANVGDFLSIAVANGEAWIAWSDTTDGDADVRVAHARMP